MIETLQDYILLRPISCFHKTKASTAVSYLSKKNAAKVHKFIILSIFQVFCSKCPLWSLRYQLITLIYITKPWLVYTNANSISLGKIFATQDTFRRGG